MIEKIFETTARIGLGVATLGTSELTRGLADMIGDDKDLRRMNALLTGGVSEAVRRR